MVGPDGALRPHYRFLADRIAQMDNWELQARLGRADQYLTQAGVHYRDAAEGDAGDAAERGWPLGFLPLVLDAAEWQRMERGLKARAQYLEALLADLYGARSVVRDGVLPASVLAGDPEFLLPLANQAASGQPLLTFLAIDLRPRADGGWDVVADRTQAPSGAGFALENRVATGKAFPDILKTAQVQRLAGFFHAFRDELHDVADRLGGGGIAVLTPGPMSETAYEHAYLARYLGLQLVEGGDLTVAADKVFLRSVGGDRVLKVLWRRMDADYADPLELLPTSQIGTPGLCRAIRAGSVRIVNALGAGILESPALAPYEDALAEHLTGGPLAMRMRRGTGPTASAPFLTGGTLTPRALVLRVYLARCAGAWRVMPGGFARIAADGGSDAGSIRDGGRSVDVWVLSDGIRDEVTLLSGTRPFRRQRPGPLPARAADNLFWLGRQVERLDQATRLVRLYRDRADGTLPGPVDAALRHGLARFGVMPRAPRAGLLALAETARAIAFRIRDRFSPDGWRVLSEVPRLLEPGGKDDITVANNVLGRLAGFTGLVAENMYRLDGWRFLQCGRKIERGIAASQTLADLIAPALGDDALDAMLELADSRLTYRRRYSVELWRPAVLDMAVLDPLNPRSLATVAQELEAVMLALPGDEADSPPQAPLARAARLSVRLRTATAPEVTEAFLRRIGQDLADISDLLAATCFTPSAGPDAALKSGRVE